uniref:Ovate family protein n=1 Tax=Rhabditophanes sp. KR3021 TaxID=114890 RepID=A0AC35UIA4_9BILA
MDFISRKFRKVIGRRKKHRMEKESNTLPSTSEYHKASDVTSVSSVTSYRSSMSFMGGYGDDNISQKTTITSFNYVPVSDENPVVVTRVTNFGFDDEFERSFGTRHNSISSSTSLDFTSTVFFDCRNSLTSRQGGFITPPKSSTASSAVDSESDGESRGEDEENNNLVGSLCFDRNNMSPQECLSLTPKMDESLDLNINCQVSVKSLIAKFNGSKITKNQPASKNENQKAAFVERTSSYPLQLTCIPEEDMEEIFDDNDGPICRNSLLEIAT